MNLILLHREDFVAAGCEEGPARVRLTGRRHAYVREVHRAEPGDALRVGLLNGGVGSGEVVRCDDVALEMDVRLDRTPPPPARIDLILAMPRPLVLERVLIAATSMGVKRIFLVNANRVERSFFQSRRLRAEELPKPLYLGLEQAGDTQLPEIEIRTRFKPFVEDELPRLIEGRRAFVAHPEVETPCPRAVAEPVTLVVGPEGGFVPYELEKLEVCGCAPVTLGDRILRVETAIPALIARLG